MRNVVLLAASLLGACSTAPAATPVHGVTPGHKCETDDTARFIGQPGTSETGAAIKQASHAAVLRWAPPGTMLTMDFREDRVTVHLDEANKVTEIKCG
jgi:peptidase inhibitor I78 family protein